MQLIKTLSKKNIMIRLNNIGDKITVPDTNFMHEMIFIADLGCQRVPQLLKNVIIFYF